MELNQRYPAAGGAVVSDGTPEPAWARDRELYYQATTWPGARVPHVWLERERQRVSTIDLVGHGRFTVLTGIGGEGWRAAAAAVAAATGVAIATFSIGPAGCDVQDVYGDWYTASEIEEDGCVLVRPDMHVAWRAPTLVADPAAALAAVFAQLLGP